MKVNFAMWQKALNIIPEVSKEEVGPARFGFALAHFHVCRGSDHDFSFSCAGRNLRLSRSRISSPALVGFNVWLDHGTCQQ